MNSIIDFNKINLSLSRKKQLRLLIIGSAIVLNILPLALKDRVNNNAKLMLMLGGVTTALMCLNLPDIEHEKKIDRTRKDTELKFLKTALTGDIAKKQTILEIANQQEITQIVERVPFWQKGYFAVKYGVQNLLTPEIEIDEPEQPEAQPQVINAPKNIFEATIERAEQQEETVFDWMRKALKQSCFLAGKKRSGKTYFMKWLLAGYIAECRPNDIFYVSDPHYDNVDFDDPWITQEADKKLISVGRLVKSESDTLKMLDEVLASFRKRKENGLTVKKGVGLIRLFMDEVDSYSPEAQEEISAAIKTIEYEAAKYGITVCLGVHSIKKGEMGIDSSVIDSMLQVLFAGIVLDPNSVLSGAFKGKPALKREIDNYKASFKTNRVVCVKDDTETFVSHIPDLILPDIKIDDEDQQKMTNKEAYQSIKNWCVKCFEQLQKYPNPDQLRQAWQDYTKKELTDGGLLVLIENLKADGILIN